MSKPSGASARQGPRCIRLRGVRQNNLRNLDLDLPMGRLVVVTGLSGSGKSSLAFDTLYAEGQRRYIETFSPYARQFFDRMDKPAVDRIENIPPAIAIEQRNAVRTTRSTVGTMTELSEHSKALWHQLSVLHCRQCHQPVRREPPQVVWSEASAHASLATRGMGVTEAPLEGSHRDGGVLHDVSVGYAVPGAPVAKPGAGASEWLVTFDLPLSDKLTVPEQLALLGKQGFARVLWEGAVRRLADVAEDLAARPPLALVVVVDRVRMGEAGRARFVEACEQSYQFGRGRLVLRHADGTPWRAFSAGFHCAACDVEYREPTPALFSFNHPVGACPECKGFGRVIGIDPNLAVPDRSRTLAGGAVKPWQSGMSAECQADLARAARKAGVPMNVPFAELSESHRRWVMDGDDDYDADDPARSWPRLWYGVKGYFRWLEGKAYKMHVRVLLSRYRSYRTCPACEGRRFNPDSLLHRLPLPTGMRSGGGEPSITLAEFNGWPANQALECVGALASQHRPAPHEPLGQVLGEMQARLAYLVEAGLGYLTLDRPTRTLSGGETARVNLTTCLGSRLVNTLYVLDEPSVGLHPRDTERLVRILARLRDLGNTVVVVEHEPAVMRAADHLVDLGPGHGETGGSIVFDGPPSRLAEATQSLTADYLLGRRSLPVPPRRPVRIDVPLEPALRLRRASRHNLRDLSVDIPLGRLVVITGVSGSGKTTLVREVLMPLLESRLGGGGAEAAEGDGEEAEGGAEAARGEGIRCAELLPVPWLASVLLVDQASLGRTPRSNPAVYVGAFDHVRATWAASPAAKARGMAEGAFSFNSAQGRCARCGGAGHEKIEMQFLSDVYVRCPACDGRRYQGHVLDVKVDGPSGSAWSIADLLGATVEDAVAFLDALEGCRSATRAASRLRHLIDVGLGYLRCGQPVNTLSGGECQRLKLASHLAEWGDQPGQRAGKPTLFVFDEPTTGLHFDDVRVLVGVFHRLVEAGHSVLVVEHNLEVVRQADWLIDLGPGAGSEGGLVVATGTPEVVAAHPGSITGRFLREELPPRSEAATPTTA